jgi:hypothetical protein
MSKIRRMPEVMYRHPMKRMSADSKCRVDVPAAAQQRFPSLFLRSQREIFDFLAALITNITQNVKPILSLNPNHTHV